MAIGIFGLPLAGKTSIFNAVTRGQTDSVGSRSSNAQPNIGVTKVPDLRLGKLAEISKPKRVVPAEVEYVDVPAAPEGIGTTKGIGGEFLNVLQRCEALLLVVRAFEDPAVPHTESFVDPFRDAENLQMELMFSDLSLLERRTQRIETQMRSAKASDREGLQRENALIVQIREQLENEIPVREHQLPPAAQPLLENFQLLSAKPLMIVFNIDETSVNETETIETKMAASFSRPHVGVAAVSGKLEVELGQMDPEEELEFRDSLGAGEPSLDRMVRLSYSLLGLISFLTTGPDETRAWTIRSGTSAVDAAAKIHSDIQRGFIRAEIVSYDDLVRTGSTAEARKQAALRTEGKQYTMKDGDVVNFLFNV